MMLLNVCHISPPLSIRPDQAFATNLWPIFGAEGPKCSQDVTGQVSNNDDVVVVDYDDDADDSCSSAIDNESA